MGAHLSNIWYVSCTVMDRIGWDGIGGNSNKRDAVDYTAAFRVEKLLQHYQGAFDMLWGVCLCCTLTSGEKKEKQTQTQEQKQKNGYNR